MLLLLAEAGTRVKHQSFCCASSLCASLIACDDDDDDDDDGDDDDCEEGFPAFAATESTRCLSLRNTALNSSTTLNTQHLTLNTKH